MAPLWQRLAEAHLVTGDPLAPAAPGPAWYASTLLGFAAWLEALSFVIVIAVLFEGKASMGISGALACAGGLALLRASNPFVT